MDGEQAMWKGKKEWREEGRARMQIQMKRTKKDKSLCLKSTV